MVVDWQDTRRPLLADVEEDWELNDGGTGESIGSDALAGELRTGVCDLCDQTVGPVAVSLPAAVAGRKRHRWHCILPLPNVNTRRHCVAPAVAACRSVMPVLWRAVNGDSEVGSRTPLLCVPLCACASMGLILSSPSSCLHVPTPNYYYALVLSHGVVAVMAGETFVTCLAALTSTRP